MAVYTVHEPPQRRDGETPAPERFIFVRDGFSFWAFLLGPLWMLRHRMWLVLFGLGLMLAGLDFASQRLSLSSEVGAVVILLLALLIGFEAGTLRRFTLARRKWSNVGIIVGDDLEAAERRFFDAWTKLHGSGTPPAIPPLRNVPRSLRPQPADTDVVGLFPQPGAPR
jgi:hypothetical protein